MKRHDVGGATRLGGAGATHPIGRRFNHPAELCEGIAHVEDRQQRPLRKTPILSVRRT
jgi:hypothetical protein